MDTKVSEEERKMILIFTEIGCCKRCALRLLCRNLDFTQPDKYFKQNEETEANGDDEVEMRTKRCKFSPCILCLDILDESYMDHMLTELNIEQVCAYDHSDYICCLSPPTCLSIRERSVKVYIEEKYPEFIPAYKHIAPLNRVWRQCMALKLNNILNKMYEPDSKLKITFIVAYKENDKVPPETPTWRARFKSMTVYADPIFFAGRYCKLSRNLGQTPWIHEDTNITECVQDYIFEAMEATLGYPKDSLVFSASGREDYDVRCLGRGRPFYIQVNDPKITVAPYYRIKALQQMIELSKVVKVRDFQMVSKKELSKIKDGEEFGRKHYRAVCITTASDMDKVIETLNNHGPFEIKQKTPLRVLHRRTLAERSKKIYRMKATKFNGQPNMFSVKFITQAGTYVKELVHGDLNRTKPSLRDILKADVDILTLDVVAIKLNFPPIIPDEQYTCPDPEGIVKVWIGGKPPIKLKDLDEYKEYFNGADVLGKPENVSEADEHQSDVTQTS